MAHRFEVRPRFYELDPYGHVNHTAYFGYFEAGRVEALAEAGYGLNVMKEAGFQIVLIEATARFLMPAALHEDLVITTSVVEVTRATSMWHQDMKRDADLLATLDVKAAFTNLAGRPTRPPDGFTTAFAPEPET